jgi:hypothetical protein
VKVAVTLLFAVMTTVQVLPEFEPHPDQTTVEPVLGVAVMVTEAFKE